MNLGLKRETMWKEFPPYKNILISIDALPHPPDGWEWRGCIRVADKRDRKDIHFQSPEATIYSSEEEALQAGYECGKVQIDNMA